MQRCFKSSSFDAIKMMKYVQEATRAQHSRMDYLLWAQLRGVGCLKTRPKGHAAGSKPWLRDIKLFVSLNQTYAGWQENKPKLNLLNKRGIPQFKVASYKSTSKTNNHYSKLKNQEFREERELDLCSMGHGEYEKSFRSF